MEENVGYLQIIMETVITFFVLLILTRLLGKKQLSHLTFFNYITGITIGSIAANMIILSSNDFLKELTSLVLWCTLTIVIGYISLKSGKIRTILDGQPTIVIKKGIIDKQALSKTKLNIDDLTMMLRKNNVFTITEVDYAILEPDGELSILKKPQFQNTNKSDFNLTSPTLKFVPSEIIVDGKVIEKNLKELGLSREWLDRQLEKAGIYSTKDVFYAEIQSDGQLYIQHI